MRIFSDPHIGRSSKAHTTGESRKRLSKSLLAYAMAAATAPEGESVICAGDLFDTFSNSEADILDGYALAAKCSVVLAGNHDIVNRADVVGSLEVVDNLAAHAETCEVVISPDMGSPYYIGGEFEGMQAAFIPHHASQQLFDEAVEDLCSDSGTAQYRAIFLHCNFDNSMTDGSDTSLNLTREQATSLLEKSDYIFIGHEHAPAEHMDGRLIMIGNTHPTNFGDISDKYYWDLTPTGLTKTKLWDAGQKHAVLDITDEFLPAPKKGVDFIDVVGKLPQSRGNDLSQYLSDLWHYTDPLMVRNSVEIVSESMVSAELVDFDNLREVVRKQLEGSPMQELWDFYSSKIIAQEG